MIGKIQLTQRIQAPKKTQVLEIIIKSNLLIGMAIQSESDPSPTRPE